MKKLGIIGGMGPVAGTYVAYELMQARPAMADGDYLPSVIINEGDIPSRQEAILYNGLSPVPSLLQKIQYAEQVGCDVVWMACNTIHYYWDEIQPQTSLRVLNMIDMVCDRLHQLALKEVTVLATQATIDIRLYQKYAHQYGINIQIPDSVMQTRIDSLIMTLKNGVVRNMLESMVIFEEIVSIVSNNGNEKKVTLIACTELSMLASYGNYTDNYRMYDAVQLMIQGIRALV